MQVPAAHLLKLAEKLIEVFAQAGADDHAFGRYWRLVAALETFSGSVVWPFEEEMAKALRMALEGRLRRHAPHSIHDDAAATGVLLGSPPRRTFRKRVLRSRTRKAKFRRARIRSA